MSKVCEVVFRNQYTMNEEKVSKRKVNLENWLGKVNVGDALAPTIYEWMLTRKNISPEQRVLRTKHLMTVGSIIVMGKRPFDATIWGSGLLNEKTVHSLTIQKLFRKLDIRAVRGPITRSLLQTCGYYCPKIYGDPGILMPLIYHSTEKKVKGKISVIRHFRMADLDVEDGYFKIDPRTGNYQAFIDQICSSERVISSSLHGIILAESYGIPAIFLQEGMEDVLMKFYDWYYSTGRKNVKIAYSVEEAAAMEPMELPKLDLMQEVLLKCFPYDLFEK